MESNPKPFYEKLSHSLISIILVITILYVGQHILIPFAFAGLLSIVLIKPTFYFEKRGLGRSFSALLSVLLAVLIFFLLFFFIYSQVLSFSSQIPKLNQNLSQGFNDLELWAKVKFKISSSRLRKFTDSLTSNTLVDSGAVIGSVFSTLSSTVIYMILIPIYAFLMLIYRRLFVKFFVTSFAEHHTGKVYEIIFKTQYVIKNYMIGLMTETLIVAIMNSIGFFLLGVRYAFLLAVIAALLNLVPYLGIFLAAILCVLITFATDTPATVAGVAVVLTIVHLIDSNILIPRIVGSKVKINALVTILGVICGSALWGVPGMFLAIPLIALIKVIFDGVDGWNSWGLILGGNLDDEPIKKKVRFFFFKR